MKSVAEKQVLETWRLIESKVRITLEDLEKLKTAMSKLLRKCEELRESRDRLIKEKNERRRT